MADPATDRLPTYFVSHGGGPWPWMMDRMPGWERLHESLAALPAELGRTPRAILCVSAHWEEAEFTVQTSPHPPMLYDYGGFPDFTYRIQYPAPGSPEVAERVGELLSDAGIPVGFDGRRGYDHGTFCPLYVSYPNADVPILQLSLRYGLDPEVHLAAGRALAPLRDENVLILGSGFSYHNLGQFFSPAAAGPSKQFDDWLATTMLHSSPDDRTKRLIDWERAPAARACHPREEHLLPLMVAVGAAENEDAVRIYHEDSFMGRLASSSYRLGAAPNPN